MESFEVGDKIEALDIVGYWARGFVLEVLADGYHVSFDGWSNKWNRVVSSFEIRGITEQTTVNVSLLLQ